MRKLIAIVGLGLAGLAVYSLTFTITVGLALLLKVN